MFTAAEYWAGDLNDNYLAQTIEWEHDWVATYAYVRKIYKCAAVWKLHTTIQQRCWFKNTALVLDAFPPRVDPVPWFTLRIEMDFFFLHEVCMLCKLCCIRICASWHILSRLKHFNFIWVRCRSTKNLVKVDSVNRDSQDRPVEKNL